MFGRNHISFAISFFVLFLGAVTIQTPISVQAQESSFQAPARETLIMLSMAHKLLELERHAETAQILWRLYSNADSSFLEDKNNPFAKPESSETPYYYYEPTTRRSLKEQLRLILAALPQKTRDNIELIAGEEARQALDKAIETGDEKALENVFLKYYSTKASVDAAFLLGFLQFNAGKSSEALATMERLSSLPEAEKKYDPAFSLIWGASIIQSGKEGVMQKRLESIRAKIASANWSVKNSAQLGLNLTPKSLKLLGGQAASLKTIQKARSEYDSLIPLIIPRWSVPTANSPVVNTLLEKCVAIQDNNAVKNFSLGLKPLLSKPVFCQNMVLYRDVFHLTALDRSTGKKIWQTGTDFSPIITKYEALAKSEDDKKEFDYHYLALFQTRLTLDHTWNSITVDEQNSCIYVIDDSMARYFNQKPFSGKVSFEQKSHEPPALSGAWKENRLSCYDLKTGKLRWTTGLTAGNKSADKALAKTTYLGTPKAENGKLYSMAEEGGQIKLICQDAKKGNLNWSVGLGDWDLWLEDVMLNLRPVGDDSTLFCPLPGNTLAAVSRVDRSPRWSTTVGRGFRGSFVKKEYLNKGYSNTIFTLNNLFSSFENRLPENLYYQNGVLLYMPSNDKNLYNINGESGEAINKYSVGLANTVISFDGIKLIIASNSGLLDVSALLQPAKKIEWEINPKGEAQAKASKRPNVHQYKEKGKNNYIIAAEEDLPRYQPIRSVGFPIPGNIKNESFSSWGYIDGDWYYSPLKSGQALRMNLKDPKQPGVIAKNPMNIPLGAMLYSNGAVYSQSYTQLNCFDVAEAAAKNITKLVKEAGQIKSDLNADQNSPNNQTEDNGTDVKPLLISAQMNWEQGKFQQAFSDYQTAMKGNPQATAPVFCRFILDTWKTKNADSFRKEQTYIETLFEKPEYKLDFFFADLEYKIAKKQYDMALTSLKKYIETGITLDDNFLVPVPLYEYRGKYDRGVERSMGHRRDLVVSQWLKEFRISMNPTQWAEFESWQGEQVKSAIESGDWRVMNRLRRYIVHVSPNSYLQLQDGILAVLQKEKKFAQVELIYREKRLAAIRANNPAAAAESWFAQTQWLVRSGFPDQAALAMKQIQKNYPDQKACKGKTADEFIASIPETNAVRKAFEQKTVWASGLVERKASKNHTPSAEQLAQDKMCSYGSTQPFFNGCRASFIYGEVTSPAVFFDRLGREMYRIPTGNIQSQQTNYNGAPDWKIAEHLFIHPAGVFGYKSYDLLSDRTAAAWVTDGKPIVDFKAGRFHSFAGTIKTTTDNQFNFFTTQGMFNNILPGVRGNCLIVKSDSDTFAAYDLLDGRIRWRYQVTGIELFPYADDFRFCHCKASSISLEKSHLKQNDKFSKVLPALWFDIETGLQQDYTELPPGEMHNSPEGLLIVDFRFNYNRIANNGSGFLTYTRKNQGNTIKYFPVLKPDTNKKASIIMYNPNTEQVVWEKSVDFPQNSPVSVSINTEECLFMIFNPDTGEVETCDTRDGKTLFKTTFECANDTLRENVKTTVGKNLTSLKSQKEAAQKKYDEMTPNNPERRNLQREISNISTSIRTNETILSVIDKKLTYVLGEREGDDVLLFAYITWRGIKEPVQPIFQVRNIPHFCGYSSRYDKTGKRLWASEGILTLPFCYQTAQDLPFWVFAGNKPNKNGFYSGIICLQDKRTGKNYYVPLDNPLNYMKLYGNIEKGNVYIRSNYNPTVIIKLTDKPEGEREKEYSIELKEEK